MNTKIQRPAIPKVSLPTIDDIIRLVKEYIKTVVVIDAEELALKAGNLKAVNSVLVGTMLSVGKLRDFIDESVLLNSLNEVNRKAVYLGMDNYSVL